MILKVVEEIIEGSLTVFDIMHNNVYRCKIVFDYFTLLFYNETMMNEKLYTAREACEILGVNIKTLQRWDREGIAFATRTPTNRRRFSQSEINRLLNLKGGNNLNMNSVEENAVAIYGRVSSHEQKAKGDLDRQIGSIMMKINGQYSNVLTITDVGSGLNDKRKGLNSLMNLAKERKISKVYITYKDRLTRFGFNYLEMYFNSHNVEIAVLNDESEDKSPQQELIDDLMAIIASFSGKLYGLRSGKNKVVTEKIKNTIEDNL